jgi:hypothetical protein
VDTRHGVCRLTELRGTVLTPSARRRSLFEARQPVREFDPVELVTGPAVSDRWKCVWIIEAAGGHVDGRPVFRAPIRQRGAAAPTESPRDGRRRVVFNRFPGGECEGTFIHVRPRYYRRGGSLATSAALTSAGNQRFALNSIPHRATQTPTLNNLAHGTSPPVLPGHDGRQVRLVDDHVSASPTTYNSSTVMIPANTIDPLPRMTV